MRVSNGTGIVLARSGWWFNWLLESDVADTDVVARVVKQSVRLEVLVRPARLSQRLQTAGLQLGSIDPNPICADCRYRTK